jgi:hypothetical protein
MGNSSCVLHLGHLVAMCGSNGREGSIGYDDDIDST